MTNSSLYPKKSIKMSDFLMYIVIQFPISSMIKVYFDSLNLILTGVCFCLFFMYYILGRFKYRELFLIFYIASTLVQNIVMWGLDYLNVNMLFYFPFLILYFCFFVKNVSSITEFMKNHKNYIDAILIIWNSFVFISFFIPSCYIYEGETLGFVSFAGTTFLLCPMAIQIFSLLAFQYSLYHKRIYMFALLIPSLCVLLGTTRTYLVILMCAWMVFVYLNIKNQRNFFPIMIFALVLFVIVVFLSPIKNKFLDTYNRSETVGLDPLATFTSGRSVFWAYDMQQIFNNHPLKIVFGNGVNYLYEINRLEFSNPLWAHNDYIQILSDYGLFGLGIYLYMIYYVIKGVLGKYKIPITIIGTVVLMWAFNAFFNMFYTYFCATLAFPFFLLLIRNDTQNRQNKCNDQSLNKKTCLNKLNMRIK